MTSKVEADATILIVGSGFAGLCMAMQLEKAGLTDYIILEKGDRVGGTWRDNVYPGAACDVPAMLYCFSFERKTDWSRRWAPQPEILDYIDSLVEKYRLAPKIRLGQEVETASFDEATGTWRVRTTKGDELRSRLLVSAVGQLNRAAVPRLEGIEAFKGSAFHAAEWERGFDPAGKTIGVVGTAATAVQLVPEIAKQAQKLFVFQRSPNWLVPKNDQNFSKATLAIFRWLPFLALLYRWLIWVRYELTFRVIRRNPLASHSATMIATYHLENQIPDANLRKALIPTFPIGAKRILISDDYYPALMRDDVELVSEPIDHVDERAVVTKSGASHPVDAIIFATGFKTTEFLAPMHVEGSGGRSLDDAWKDGAEAYLGMTVAGFPNFFMMYGPNTNLGHNSILFMLECQTRYIIRCMRRLLDRDLRSFDVRPEVMESYNRHVADKLARTVWSDIGESWYKTKAGRITNNWYATTAAFWWRTRRVDFDAFVETS